MGWTKEGIPRATLKAFCFENFANSWDSIITTFWTQRKYKYIQS